MYNYLLNKTENSHMEHLKLYINKGPASHYKPNSLDLYLERRSKRKEILRTISKDRIYKTTCELIKEHHENMKNDPEHLTTSFIQYIVKKRCVE